jgi:Flp pilus assembly protein TadG
MKVQIDLHGQKMALKRSLGRAARTGESHNGSWSLVRGVRALLCGGSQGSALVEIALVLPILLALLTAICAFAVGFNNELTLTTAVGAGAQYVQLIRTSTTITDPCAATLTAIENAAPNLTPGSIILSITMNGTTYTGPNCSNDMSELVQGQPVTVSAKYPCALPIYGTTFSTACQLSAKTTEYEY